MSKKPEVLGEEILRKHVCCYADAELDAEFNAIRAAAWDEGHDAGWRNATYDDTEPYFTINPYKEN